jgi:hypothetical protein
MRFPKWFYVAALLAPSQSWSACYNDSNLHESPKIALRTMLTNSIYKYAPVPTQEGAGMSLRIEPILETLSKAYALNYHFDKDSGVVYFLEADAKGKERVCRTESWDRPFASNSVEEAAELSERREKQKQDQGRNAILAPLLEQGYLMAAAYNYHYDTKGQLIEVSSVQTEPLYKNQVEASCYAYDDLGRPISYAKIPGVTKCVDGLKKAELIYRYTYVNRMQPWLAREILESRKEDGQWTKSIDGFGHPGTPFFKARVDNKLGLYELRGAPDKRTDDDLDWDIADRNAANASTKNFIYYFPSPGPTVLLDDLTKVSQYNRVRVSYVGGRADQINEVITAKGELLARYFADDNTFRQDIFKNGKLVRVLIASGGEHIGNKSSHLYYEDPALLQAFAAKKKTTVNQLSSRVYDVSPSGQWKLIAAGWFKDPPKPKKRWLPVGKKSEVVLGTGGVETVDGSKTWDDDPIMLREYGMDKAMKLAQKFGRPDPSY